MVVSLTSSSPPILPGEGAEREAALAVEALRAALRKGDAEAVQSVRWLARRPPGERDLLSDLAAGEGLELAVRRLSRFWRRAEARVERVRLVSGLEAEVYERLALPGEAIPIVSLVRRAAVEAPWRVVCTNEAHDERLTVWLGSKGDELDDVAWTRAYAARFGGGAELLMEGIAGVLGAHHEAWLAHVRGPFVPLAWPAILPGEGGGLIELTAALVPQWEARAAQIEWLLRATAVFLEELGGAGAYFPAHEKLVVAPALDLAVRGALRPDQAMRMWARIEDAGGYVFTSGLRQLGLTEVEAPRELMGDPQATIALVRWLGAKLVESSHDVLALGTELVLSDRTFTIVPGRRGPRRGKSYGRWGALCIADVEERLKRGSRTRIRVPEPLS
jgi:hypothetical protein